jgi:tetratricopeptide (TPR) repeat protein
MQTIMDLINSLRGKPWFSELFIILFFVITYLFLKISTKEKFLRWLIKVQPDNDDAHVKLGVLLMENKARHIEAEKYLQTAIELNPKKAESYYALYSVLVSGRKQVEAGDLVLQMLKMFPDDPLTHLFNANILWIQKEYEKAEISFRKAISIAPGLYLTTFEFGRFLASQGRLNEAITSFLKAITIEPFNYNVYLKLAQVYEENGNLQEAENMYLRIIRNWPNEIEAHTKVGFLLFMTGKNKEALQVISKSLRLTKNPVDLYGTITKELVAAKKYGAAGECAENFILSMSGRPEPFANMAWVLFSQDKKDEALNLCQQAIEADGNYVYAYSLSAQIYFEKEKYDEAERCYRKIIEIDEADFSSRHNLGLLYHKKFGRLDEAEIFYKESLDGNPGFLLAHLNLGDLYQSQSRYLEAEKAYRHAMALDNLDDFSKLQFSKVLVKLNCHDEAIETLLNIVEHDSSYYMAYVELASIQRVMGNLAETRQYADIVRSLINVGDEDYWYNLACIESISGNNDLAFDNLKNATKENTFDKTWAWKDPDLQWLWNDPRFVEIVGPKPEE